MIKFIFALFFSVQALAASIPTQQCNVTNSTIAVTGTFWQATQPVSGTFWQSTQPVSIASMPSTPVTGTFWQATQPVSIASAITTNDGGTKITAATMPAGGVGLMGWLSAIYQQLIGTLTVSGTVTANQGATWTVQPGNTANTTAWLMNVGQFGGTNVSTGQGAGGVGIPRITTSNDSQIRLLDSAGADLTSAKGAQTSRAVGIQELKDAGRNQTNYWMAIQIVTTATDALVSLTGYKGGVAVGATTTPAVVTAGKTYRITSVTMDYTTIVTTPGSVRFTLRANLSGTVVIGSPAVAIWEVGEPSGAAPVAGKKNTVTLSFPDGIEFPAGTGIGISQVGLNTVGAAAVVGYGRITINGYEY